MEITHIKVWTERSSGSIFETPEKIFATIGGVMSHGAPPRARACAHGHDCSGK